MSLRVLLVSNFSAPACGVAEFGRIMADALEHQGCSVTRWDGHYPAVYEQPYLPPDAARYDVVHFNWHPVTLNHYQPEHLPNGPLLSAYLHDIPPWSAWSCMPAMDVRFASQRAEGCLELRYPAVDWDVATSHVVGNRTVGWTGIRGDGLDVLREWAAGHAWELNLSDSWRTTYEEIERLSRSTVNVLWYHAGGRGKSLALMTAAAARRPLLVSASDMFSTAWKYPSEVYIAGRDGVPDTFEAALEHVVSATFSHFTRFPHHLVRHEGWTRAAIDLIDIWHSKLGDSRR